MARVDDRAIARNKKTQEAYDAFITALNANSDEVTLVLSKSEASYLYEHIRSKEEELRKAMEELRKYRNFFVTLRDLTPRAFDIHHDKLG